MEKINGYADMACFISKKNGRCIEDTLSFIFNEVFKDELYVIVLNTIRDANKNLDVLSSFLSKEEADELNIDFDSIYKNEFYQTFLESTPRFKKHNKNFSWNKVLYLAFLKSAYSIKRGE